MEVKILQSKINNLNTDTNQAKYKIEVVAIGSHADSIRFMDYVSRYELLKQQDITTEYYDLNRGKL